MAISEQPLSGEAQGNVNRIRRITICIGSVKTAAHVDNPTGSLARYDRARDDNVDSDNVQTPERQTFITEEA